MRKKCGELFALVPCASFIHFRTDNCERFCHYYAFNCGPHIRWVGECRKVYTAAEPLNKLHSVYLYLFAHTFLHWHKELFSESNWLNANEMKHLSKYSIYSGWEIHNMRLVPISIVHTRSSQNCKQIRDKDSIQSHMVCVDETHVSVR